MADYASLADFKLRFESDRELSLLTDSDDPAVPNDNVLQEILDGSESLVNSYVGMRYAIPLAVASNAMLAAQAKTVVLDIAVRNLLASRSGSVSEAKEKSYDQAIAWCKLVGEGSVVIPSAKTEDSTVSRDPLIKHSSETRIFTRETQKQL